MIDNNPKPVKNLGYRISLNTYNTYINVFKARMVSYDVSKNFGI